MSIFSKKDKSKEEVAIWYKIIQETQRLIMNERKAAGLQDSAAYQLPYYALLMYLLKEVGIITDKQKLMLQTMLSMHCLDSTGEDITSLNAHYETMWSRFESEEPAEKIFKFVALIEIENAESIGRDVSDEEIETSIDIANKNIKFLFENMLS